MTLDTLKTVLWFFLWLSRNSAVKTSLSLNWSLSITLYKAFYLGWVKELYASAPLWYSYIYICQNRILACNSTCTTTYTICLGLGKCFWVIFVLSFLSYDITFSGSNGFMIELPIQRSLLKSVSLNFSWITCKNDSSFHNNYMHICILVFKLFPKQL